MGCCNSTPSNTTTNPPPAAEPARIPQAPTNIASSTPIATDVPNQPIRPPSPLPKSPRDVSTSQPPWTRSHLHRQREIFFETRISGNAEVWGALRLICEALRKGNVQEAQGIIDAAHLTCPTGRVAKGRSHRTRDLQGQRIRGGVFDERGKRYDVPEWVLTDPGDIIEDAEGTTEKEIEGEEGSDTASSRPVSLSQMDKGKGKAEDVGELVQLRVRLSDQGQDVVLEVGRREKVRVVMERLRQKTGVVKCKFVLMGKCMEESGTLEDSGWGEGKMVQAFVMVRE